MAPPMQRIAAAAMMPSGVPPMPASMSVPEPGRQVEMAPATSGLTLLTSLPTCARSMPANAMAAASTAQARARVTGVASSKEKTTPSGVSMLKREGRAGFILGPPSPGTR